MLLLLRYWLDLCLLRVTPQDGSPSPVILALSLGAYILVSMLVLTVSYGTPTGPQLALLEAGLLALFVVLLLYVTGKAVRIRQTLSAMTGAGCMLGLVSLLLVSLQGPVAGGDSLSGPLSLAWLALLFWNLVVSAHIIRHALSTSFAIGIAMSILYVLISTQFIAALLPETMETMLDEAGRVE